MMLALEVPASPVSAKSNARFASAGSVVAPSSR
jgi:hypothetical protein